MILSFSLLLFGVFSLSLSMKKHFKTLFIRPPKSIEIRGLTIGGWFLIFTSFIPLIIAGPAFSITLVWWLGFLSLGIFLTAIAYTWKY